MSWEDAPIVKVRTKGVPKPVTFIYPYYENPSFLSRQIGFWNAYPEALRKYLSAIIVDDGSPNHPASDVLKGVTPFPISLYRIEVDVRWNWLAARNIAMHHAPEGWCVGTDMDHVITQEVAEALVWGDHEPGVIYRFSRSEHTGEWIHPHPNSWFMTRAMFWKFGGYDENFSGFYGSDGDARRRWSKTAPVLTLKDRLIRYEYVEDSSTTHYKRKQPEDAARKRILAARGPKWKPKVLSFPYHQVAL